MRKNIIAHSKHGGDIYRHNIASDFSVNINPLGMHPHIMKALQKSIGECSHYPDDLCEQLTRGLAGKLGLRTTQIVCGNGASDLFMGIVHALQPKKAVLFAPSFYGYTYVLGAVSCRLQYEMLLEEEHFQIRKDCVNRIAPDTDMIFLCVPNNPTGVLPDQEVIVTILEHCKQYDITVVYDQCFLEFTGKYQELNGEQFLAQYQNLIVVNAFTKTYAIPGIRLGYACAGEEMIQRISGQLAEWRVSIPAMAAGEAALWVEQHTDYLERTRTLLEEEKQYMMDELGKAGLKFFPSDADYMLLKSRLPLYEELLKRGILIRSCGNYVGLSEDFYRIALKSHEENQRLIKALWDIMQEMNEK